MDSVKNCCPKLFLKRLQTGVLECFDFIYMCCGLLGSLGLGPKVLR